jgi:hypothetical protein
MERRGIHGYAGVIVATAFLAMIASCSSGPEVGVGDASLADASADVVGVTKHDSGDGGPCKAADACGTGTQCTTGAECKSLVCTDGMCLAPTDTDGVKNDSETDVDCGGAILANGKPNPASDGAPACGDGKTCDLDGDCTSTSCQAGKCVPPTCVDKLEDGMETDVDCGGPTCGACPTGDKCLLPRDCQSLDCKNDVCLAPTDTDGIKNDSETDVDCGGAVLANGKPNPMSDGAPVCAIGKTCAIGADCAQGVCASGPVLVDNLDGGVDAAPLDAATADGGAGVLTCQPATDHDGVKNDSETDVDCGGGFVVGGGANPASDGAPACAAGKGCSITLDCQSLVCTSGVCQSPSATDGVKNDSETDIDCGGGKLAGGATNPSSDGAPACADGKACVLGTDCADLVCFTGVVTTPSADGSPIDCPAGQTCTCQAPTRTDGVENDSETDIDCGGDFVAGGGKNSASDLAPVCAVGKKCLLGTDCAEAVCNATAGAGAGPADCPTGDACTCQAPSSTDGVKNDSETDVDCGGAKLAGGAANPASDGAPVCGVGKGCLLGIDCTTGVCNSTAGAGHGPIDCPAGDACTCQAASPTDGVKNDSETDVDCGGAKLAGGGANPASDGAPGCADEKVCALDSDCLSDLCSVLSRTCVAGPSCMGLEPSAPILDVTAEGTGSTDAVGTPDVNGKGQHAGLDTCGRGEATDATGQVHESCCRSLEIPTAVLPVGEPVGTRVDKYEVTAGRMRQFVESVSTAEEPISGIEYDLRDWMLAQFNAAVTTPTTPIGTAFAAQIPAGTTVKAIIDLFPADWYSDLNIVSSLGGTTMDPGHPSGSQGCYVADGANVNGASTYWWPATTDQMVTPVKVGEDVVGSPARVYTQDYYDIKSMNCAPYWIYAAFCAWDGGHVASLAELDAVYGKQQYPWDIAGESTFLPADYTYETVGAHSFQSFVPGTDYYTGAIAAGTPGYNAVDLTVNWNNSSFGGNAGLFYFYPNGGGGPTDAPDSVGNGYDFSPFIAAPGRFYLDTTAILSPSGAGTEGWQDLGANMLEMTDTVEGGTAVFCDCSTGGSTTKVAACSAYSCPNTTPTTWPIPLNGGTALPEVRWEGGSWEGHEPANPASPPYFSDSAYSEPVQTQYGKAGFRCARAPE